MVLLQLEKVQTPSRLGGGWSYRAHDAVLDVLAGCVARSGPGRKTQGHIVGQATKGVNRMRTPLTLRKRGRPW